jgi:acyl-CoA synthetase (NDP forming)
LEPGLRDLTSLFSPRSVAIVGASADPDKWGHWLAEAALEGRERRAVHLVNPRGGEVLGQPVARSLGEIEGGVELAVMVVPEQVLERAVEDALAAGARGIVAITAGLGETGEHGRRRELALAERVRAAGAILVGPNCIGLFDAQAQLRLSSNTYPSGAVGLVSQSGNVSIEIGLLLERFGLGLSRFASLGNQADVTLAEMVADLAAHEPTRAIAVYVEDFADGRAFVEAARAAGDRKPVLLLAAGRSDAGRRAAASHTGSLASDSAVVDAACRAAGVVRVDSTPALAVAAQALLASARARGRRVLVIGDGGGHGVLAGDLCAAAGLEVPLLSGPTVERVEGVGTRLGASRNPIDMIGDGPSDLHAYSLIVRCVVEAGEVDAALVTGYLGGYCHYSPAYGDAEELEAGSLATLQDELGVPIVAHSMFEDRADGTPLRRPRLAAYQRVDDAVHGLAAVVAASGVELQPGAPPGPQASEGPPPGAPLGYAEARALLAAAGLPFGRAVEVRDAEEAAAAAERLALLPATLKASDARLVHKSDLGGVRVGIESARALREAAQAMLDRLDPEALVVEETADASGGVELVAGIRRDPRFGPVLLVGFGGTLVEVLRSVAVALAPVDAAEAERLLRSLRGAALLDGPRGTQPVDVRAAAEAIAALSRLGASRPDVAELEVNPLLVLPRGCVALDARVVLGVA